MFRKALVFSLIILFIALAAGAQGDDSLPAADSAFTRYLDRRIPALLDDYDIPGAIVALIREGRPVWSKAYGFADLAAGRKMTTHTYCRVESISKPVTAWGVMKLVEQGRIELDAPVVDYLKSWTFPESRFSTGRITVRQLLSHSAGLDLGTIGVRYDPRGEIPSLEETLSRDAVLRQEPGKSFSYSNTGFNVLELLIEEVTGRDFAGYMREEVLLPLGMEHARFTWSESFDPPVPNGYDSEGRPIPVYVYPDKAAGGLFAPVGDIAAFVTAGMTGFTDRGLAVLSTQSIDQLYQPAVEKPGVYALAFDSYGLGHFTEWLPNGMKAVAHGGQGSGWMTHFHAVPETGDGIVLFTNSQRSWPFFAYMLNDWAKWRGFSSVGMGKIVTATKILWALAALLFLAAAWVGWRLSRDLLAGRRRLAPLARESRLRRTAQAGVAMVVLGALLWALNQKYLFLVAVFPVTIGWLGRAAFLFALVTLISALFPGKRTIASEKVRTVLEDPYQRRHSV